MNELQAEIENVELSIDEAKKMVEKGRMAEKLSRNREFKALVLEGYFVEEAARLCLLSTDPNLPENIREAVLRDMNGPGAIKRYFSTIVTMGQMAAQELMEHQETLDELRAEENEA